LLQSKPDLHIVIVFLSDDKMSKNFRHQNVDIPNFQTLT
jgi:hypothetical protein